MTCLTSFPQSKHVLPGSLDSSSPQCSSGNHGISPVMRNYRLLFISVPPTLYLSPYREHWIVWLCVSTINGERCIRTCKQFVRLHFYIGPSDVCEPLNLQTAHSHILDRGIDSFGTGKIFTSYKNPGFEVLELI